MRRALVTGGRGFVGAWLCRALGERGVEATPGLRRLCAHNVVLAEKR